MSAPEPNAVIAAVLRWARSRDAVRGIALVGSYARGTARRDSDIDLVLLVDDPAAFRSDAAWPGAIDWTGLASGDPKWRDEDYGIVWSRRIFAVCGIEAEIAFAPLSWAATVPVDAGTRRVVQEGCRILFDPEGRLRRLIAAIGDIEPQRETRK